MLRRVTFPGAVQSGQIKVAGQAEKVDKLFSLFDTFNANFEIVGPEKPSARLTLSVWEHSTLLDQFAGGHSEFHAGTYLLGAGRGAPERPRTNGGGRAASLQTHFWARNAPYALADRGNPLKSQQMRPPSERTRTKRPD
jgi:hypothetical protein